MNVSEMRANKKSKKISTNGFVHCKLSLWKSLSLEYDQNRTKLSY